MGLKVTVKCTAHITFFKFKFIQNNGLTKKKEAQSHMQPSDYKVSTLAAFKYSLRCFLKKKNEMKYF